MVQYHLYRDGLSHGGVNLMAVRSDEEVYTEGYKLVSTVDADATTAFNPSSSAFQSSQTSEYIETGLEYPNNLAIIIH